MESSSSSKNNSSKTLRIVSLILKLILIVLIFVTILQAGLSFTESDGWKGITSLEEKRKSTWNLIGAEVTWSQEDKLVLEGVSFLLAILALIISILSFILQCAVRIKVVSYVDAFLCLVEFALLVSAGGTSISGVAQHCEQRETLSMTLPYQEGSQFFRSEDTFFGVKFNEIMDKHAYEAFDGRRNKYKHTPEEDKLYTSVTVKFPTHWNRIRPNASKSVILKYKKKCKKRWESRSKIITGVLCFVAGLGFVGAAVLSIIGGCEMNPTPQNASVDQPGECQPSGAGEPGASKAAFSWSYASANSFPPHQQGYRNQTATVAPGDGQYSQY